MSPESAGVKSPRKLPWRAALFAAALGASLLAAWLVRRGNDSNRVAVLWALSLPAFLAAARTCDGRPAVRRPTLQSAALLLAAAAIPVLVRVANFDSDRMHGDEFLTGYFSLTHDFSHRPFFGYMPEKWEWQGQFPTTYFFLQKLLLAVLGVSTTALRLSIQVYVAIIGLCVFLIAREILGNAAGMIAVFLYSFLAASVYLETLAHFFTAATAAFCVFFYFALRAYKTGSPFHAAAAGFACGFCYLFYYSSYLAFPVLVTFAAVHGIRARRTWPLQNFAISLAGMLLVLAPFLAFIARSGNYAFRRVEDMSLVGGAAAEEEARPGPLTLLAKNVLLSANSLFRDGIAGAGGFEFGHFAILEPLSVALFTAGLLLAAILVFRKTELLFVFATLAGCLAMVALAVPPPTGHRFSLALPFVAIVMALPLRLLLERRWAPATVRAALVAGLLFLYASLNERRLVEAVIRDASPDELRLSELLNQRFGPRHLYVAAFDAFFFEKVFYFQDRWKGLRRVDTKFHSYLLENFRRGEKYVYVMILGDAFRRQFEKADPAGRYTRFSVGYSLFFN